MCLGIAASGALLVAACAPARVTSGQANDLVLVSTRSGLAGVDWAARRVVYQAPNALPSADWSRLVTSADDGKLQVLDSRTGALQSSVDVPTGFVVSAVSKDGQKVALSSSQGGSARTRIVVADPSGKAAQRTFDLQGNYEPDAFASDNQHLFVLEYLPPEAPDRYRVRQLDLKTGNVGGIGSRDKSAVPEEEMRGTRRMHALSPDGNILYTLYTHQPGHLHSRDLAAGLTQSRGDVHAFVHVLNLSEGWAYCLDLPQPMGIGPALAHTLALSTDGGTLYVADRSSGEVVVADTHQLIIRAMVDVGADPRADKTPAAAQVGQVGALFLSSASGLLVLEPKTLAVLRRLPVPGMPTGLGVSVDGQRLFLSTADQLFGLDQLNGWQLGAIATPGSERIEHVGTAELVQ
jgi:DNA-binding beta-propeller fold protein YncE